MAMQRRKVRIRIPLSESTGLRCVLFDYARCRGSNKDLVLKLAAIATLFATSTASRADSICVGGPLSGIPCIDQSECGICLGTGHACAASSDCNNACSMNPDLPCVDGFDCLGFCSTTGLCSVDSDCPDGGTCHEFAGSCSPAPCNAGTCTPTGACCETNPPFFCCDRTQADCEASGGLYRGDNNNCTDNSCTPPTGACCRSVGPGSFECLSALTQEQCQSDGGTYLGNDSVCDGNPCDPPTGACCNEPEPGLMFCDIENEEICMTFGGSYLGDGSDCSGDPCALPTGACCLTTAQGTVICDDLGATEGMCEQNLGGTYQGDNTTCMSDPCPQPTGACCGGMGGESCFIATEAECEPNFWFGPNSTCFPTNPCSAPLGACCFGANGAQIREEACINGGGVWNGEGTANSVCHRACCFNDLSCQVLSGVQCTSQGGTPAVGGASLCDGQACGSCAPPPQAESPSGCCKNDVAIAAAEALCDTAWIGCRAGCFFAPACTAACDDLRSACRSDTVPACDECQDVGENCEIISTYPSGYGPCRPPYECHLIAPFEGRCGLPNNGGPVAEDVCEASFSRLQCIQAAALGELLTYTEGIAGDAGGGLATSAEVGQIYSRDGKYGCYYTTCRGVGFVVGVGVARVLGEFGVDFGGISGASTAKCVGLDTPIANLGVSACQVFVDSPGRSCELPFDNFPISNGDCTFVGLTGGVGLGVGLGAQSVVYLECQTQTTEVGTFDEFCSLTPSTPQTNVAPVCDAGGPYVASNCPGTTASVSLNGSGSTDPNMDSLEYSWTTNCPGAEITNATSSSPTMNFNSVCSGVCLARLTVSDGTLSSQCCASIGVVDGAPTVTCPADVVVDCSADTSVASTGNATATDTCSPVVTITSSDESVSGCGNTRTITRTFTARDECDTSSTCEQVINVFDTTPPMISCPSDLTVSCTESTHPSHTGSAIATDSCDELPELLFHDVSDLNGCNASGSIVRTWRATDACGRTSTCGQTITIEVLPSCGDGIQVSGEQCDDGDLLNSNDCTNACRWAECGDGLIWNEGAGAEQCDDGNTMSGDGCDESCQVEIPPTCGDGSVDSGEQCDDGDVNNNDDCLTSCRTAVCGDGQLWNQGNGTEQCDDGNRVRGDGCDDMCQVEVSVCGNGVREFGEECDDANLIDGDGCSASCENEFTPCARDCDCYTAAIDAASAEGGVPSDYLDVCLYHYCAVQVGDTEGVCTSCTRRYGNTCAPFGGNAQTTDILCTIVGFGDYCACPSGDVFRTGEKGPSGSPIGTDDILGAIAAFGGANPFDCDAGAGCDIENPPISDGCAGDVSAASALATSVAFTGDRVALVEEPSKRQRSAYTANNASISLVPRQRRVQAGGLVVVDVFVIGVEGLIGFEVGVVIDGGRRGHFTLESIEVDTQRRDYAFVGLDAFPAMDVELGRVGGAVLAGSVDIAANRQAYVGTYNFRASDNATGAFSLQAQNEYVDIFSQFASPTIDPIEDEVIVVTSKARGR